MAESHEWATMPNRSNAVRRLEALLMRCGGAFDGRSASDIENYCYNTALRSQYSPQEEYDDLIREACSRIADSIHSQQQHQGNIQQQAHQGNIQQQAHQGNIQQHVGGPTSSNPIGALQSMTTHAGQPGQINAGQQVMFTRTPNAQVIQRGMIRPGSQQPPNTSMPNLPGSQANLMAQPSALQVALNDPSSPLSNQQTAVRPANIHQFPQSGIAAQNYQGVMQPNSMGQAGPIGPGNVPPYGHQPGVQRVVSHGNAMNVMGQGGMHVPGNQSAMVNAIGQSPMPSVAAQQGPGAMQAKNQPGLMPAEAQQQQMEEQRAIREKLASMQRYLPHLRNWLIQQESVSPASTVLIGQLKASIEMLEGRHTASLGYLQKIEEVIQRRVNAAQAVGPRPPVAQATPQQPVQGAYPMNPNNIPRRPPVPNMGQQSFPPGSMPIASANHPSAMQPNLPPQMSQNIAVPGGVSQAQGGPGRMMPARVGQQPFNESVEYRFSGPASQQPTNANPAYAYAQHTGVASAGGQAPIRQQMAASGHLSAALPSAAIEQQSSPSPSVASVTSSSAQAMKDKVASILAEKRPDAAQDSPASQSAATSGQSGATAQPAGTNQGVASQQSSESVKPPPDVAAHEFYADQIIRSLSFNLPLLERGKLTSIACRKLPRSLFEEFVNGDRLFSEFDFAAAPRRSPSTESLTDLVDRRASRLINAGASAVDARKSGVENENEPAAKRARTRREIALRNELSRLAAWCIVEFDSDWPVTAAPSGVQGRASMCDAEKYADLHCSCSLIALPAVSLKLTIPTDYPEISPSLDADSDVISVNGDADSLLRDEELVEMKLAFSSRVAALPSRYSLTALLSVWRTCVSRGHKYSYGEGTRNVVG